MPRGVKGSGPYSKFKDVENDLAKDLRPASEKPTPVRKAAAKKAAPKKAAVRRDVPAAKKPVAKALNGNGNGNGNGHASIEQAVEVTVGPEGALTFTDKSGKTQTITLAHPVLLLELENNVKDAADNYVKALAASRS